MDVLASLQPAAPLYLEPKQLREAVAQEVDAAEVVDMHTHLFAAAYGPPLAEFGIDAMLTYHYVLAQACAWRRVHGAWPHVHAWHMPRCMHATGHMQPATCNLPLTYLPHRMCAQYLAMASITHGDSLYYIRSQPLLHTVTASVTYG